MDNLRLARRLAMLIIMGGLLFGCELEDLTTVRLKVGEHFTQKIRLESDLVMMFPGFDYKLTEMTLDCRVKAVDKEGIATLEGTITTIKAKMKSADLELDYDSEQPAQQTTDNQTPATKLMKRQQAFNECFAGLVGKKYSGRIDRQGRLLDLLDVDEAIQKAARGTHFGSMFGGDQVTMLMAEGNLRDYLWPEMFAGVGRTPPTLGGTWTGSGTVVVPRAPAMVVDRTYTLKEVQKQKGQSTAQITYQITHSEKPPANQPAGQMPQKPISGKSGLTILAVKGEGKISFSLDRKLPLEQEEKFQAQVTAGPAGSAFGRPATNGSGNKVFYVVKRNITLVKHT